MVLVSLVYVLAIFPTLVHHVIFLFVHMTVGAKVPVWAVSVSATQPMVAATADSSSIMLLVTI